MRTVSCCNRPERANAMRIDAAKLNRLTPITAWHFSLFWLLFLLCGQWSNVPDWGCRTVIEHNQDRRNKMETNQIRAAFPRPANFVSVSSSFCSCQELAQAPPTLSFLPPLSGACLPGCASDALAAMQSCYVPLPHGSIPICHQSPTVANNQPECSAAL